jgi:hypothetical protein
MSAFQSLAPRPPASLETVHDILGSLVARYRQEEVLTTVHQIPAREAKFRPIPAWVTSALSEPYQAKGIPELYSHQASTAEVVRDAIIAGILVARHLKTPEDLHDSQPSPRTESLVASAVHWQSGS